MCCNKCAQRRRFLYKGTDDEGSVVWDQPQLLAAALQVMHVVFYEVVVPPLVVVHEEAVGEQAPAAECLFGPLEPITHLRGYFRVIPACCDSGRR